MKITSDVIDFSAGEFDALSQEALAGLQLIADRTNITIEQYLSGQLTDVIAAAAILPQATKRQLLLDTFNTADSATQAAIIDAVSKVPGVSVKPAEVADVAPMLKAP